MAHAQSGTVIGTCASSTLLQGDVGKRGEGQSQRACQSAAQQGSGEYRKKMHYFSLNLKH
jgi:hypothetical protein